MDDIRRHCPTKLYRWFLLSLVILGLLAAPPAAAGQATESPAPLVEGAGEESVICETDLGPPVKADEATTGTLLLETDRRDLYIPAPTLRTEVDLEVHGMVVRGRVAQTFRNPTQFWVEGKYVFPLPENAAVDELRMVVGERVIEGEIQERQQARRTYERARQAGQRASIVEQQRPNLFTAKVANMGPGEEIVVEIGYLQTLRWVDGEYRLRFPTTLTPRYGAVPDPEGLQVDPDLLGEGSVSAVLSCEDASTETSVGPEESGSLQLVVELVAGGPLATIDSSFHDVTIDIEGSFTYRVQVESPTVTDRDFELVWSPQRGADATARAWVEERDGEFFTLLMVYPPAPEASDHLTLPRETVFVIDTSGSMNGASLAQAKQALLTALGRLRPEDAFNVIQFNSGAWKLFPASQRASRYSLEQATAYVSGLTANGGTEIRFALEAALGGEDLGYPIRQVVFMTDGAVGNERSLFSYIDQHLGESRLFTVGIGSAPNSFFMRKAAESGRGTFTHIGSTDQVEERMSELFARLESPVLTDLIADWGDPLIEAFPSRVPDLYAGDPLVVVGRGYTPLEGVTLSGARGVVPWNVSATLPEPGSRTGVAKLWARAKLGEITDALGHVPEPERARQAAVDLALDFHLVSQFTSLVAVDSTPARPAGEAPVSRVIPLRTPAGWQAPASVLGLPVTATASRAWWWLGFLSLFAAFLVRFRSPVHARH